MAERKLQIDVEVEIARAKRRLDALDKKLDGVSGSATRVGTSTTSAIGAFKGFAGALLAVEGVRRAFSFAKDAAINLNAQLETTTLQFRTLMGDSGAAERQVASLFEFAKRTPFETGPIIEASRIMQTFGGNALNTEENLTLIGDAAAATSAPINELGMWVGRLFAQLEAGRPFGEAAQRLTELAVLTPQARSRMEELQKAGASAKEIFTEFQDELGRFTGAMEDQSKTWDGAVSTFFDTVQLNIAQRTTPIFEALKGVIISINEEMSKQGVVDEYLDSLDPDRAEAFAREALNAARSADDFNRILQQQVVSQIDKERVEQELIASGEQLRLTTTSAEDAMREFEAQQRQTREEQEKAKKVAEEQAEAIRKLNTAWRESVEVYHIGLGRFSSMNIAIPEVTRNIDLASLGWINATRDLSNLNIGLIGATEGFDDLHRATNRPGFFAGFMEDLGGLNTIFERAFEGGGGLGGAIQSFATRATSRALSFIPVVGPVLSQFAGAFVSGFKKLFGGLFGGPSELELQGREAGNSFIDGVIASAEVSSDRVAAAVAEGWDPRLAEFALSAQDVFTAAGLEIEDAMNWVRRFFDGIKEGPAALQPLMEQFNELRDQAQGLNDDLDHAMRPRTSDFTIVDSNGQVITQVSGNLGSGATQVGVATGGQSQVFANGGFVQAFPSGGMVLRNHVPALVEPGEFVMSRPAVNRIGVGALGAMNRGAAGGGDVHLHVNVSGFVGPNAIKELADQVNRETLRQMQLRRQL